MGQGSSCYESRSAGIHFSSQRKKVASSPSLSDGAKQNSSDSHNSCGILLVAKNAGVDGQSLDSKERLRYMDKNGKCNIRKHGEDIREKYLRDIFYTVVDMTGCMSGMFLFCLTYLATWSVFGFIWWLIAYLRALSKTKKFEDTYDCVAFVESNYLNTDDPKLVKLVKAEPNRLIPRKLAAKLKLLKLVKGDVANHYQSLKSNGTSNASSALDHSSKDCVENVYSYTTAFLFLVETETTIGYGRRAITDNCAEAVIFFVLQALAANILDAFMIGALFVKISRPSNRAETLVFSENAVIAKRDGKYCLMFRVGNKRNSLIVQCRIRAKYVTSHVTQEGVDLHQTDINVGFDTGADNLFLVTPLVISHEINEKSPFWTMSFDDLRRGDFEIIAILEGMVESTGMICQASTSYLNTEVLWGHRFAPILSQASGHFHVDYADFNQTCQVNLEPCSSAQYERNKRMGKTSSTAEVAIPEKLAGYMSIASATNGSYRLHRKTPVQKRRHLPGGQAATGNRKTPQTSSSSSAVLLRRCSESAESRLHRHRQSSLDDVALDQRVGFSRSSDQAILSIGSPVFRRYSHSVAPVLGKDSDSITSFNGDETAELSQVCVKNELDSFFTEPDCTENERGPVLRDRNLGAARTVQSKNVMTTVAVVIHERQSSDCNAAPRLTNRDDETTVKKAPEDARATFLIEAKNAV